MGAEATLNPAHLTVTPGGEAHTEITVRNNGRVVDGFTLRVLGDAANWARCEPQGISLLPGQSGTARIMFRPPPGPDLPYGPLPFAVRVISSEDPRGSVVEEGLLDIGEMPQVVVDLSPRTGRARGMASSRHRIAVDNYGNAPALVTLVGGDEADTAEVTVKPSELEVAPGAAALADVRVRGRRRFWRGPAVTHRFQVTAIPHGGEPIRSDGSLLQEAVLPSWLPKAVALAAAAAVALAVLWFAVLRPVVRNAAANAGTTAAKQAVQQALGGQPSTGGGSSPSPSSSSTPTPTTPQPAVKAPVPFSESLTPGSNPAVTAPSKHAMQITDMVLQNPAGDQGTLTLLRNGVPLLRFGLADFRVYDPHFITPIVVPAGQSFSVSVQCANGTGKPACSPSVLINGTQ
ncbi:MAG TPA: hypothetical protein VGS19_10330 [Streptosporangiaceae bacterium]|nr:hypothetical protein [Streptosporangiaceae bacterium]